MNDENKRKRLYRVQMRSVAGPMAQYNGNVDVWSDGENLFADAVRELRRTAFPDRGGACWQMTGSEVIDGR